MARGNHRFGRLVRRVSGFLGVTGPIGIAPYVHPGVFLNMPGFELAGFGETYSQSVSVTGNTAYTVITVPVGEIWHVDWINVYHESGTWQGDTLWIDRGAAGVALVLAQGMALTSDRHIMDRLNFWLYPGDQIAVGVSGYSVTGNLTVEVDHIKATFMPELRD